MPPLSSSCHFDQVQFEPNQEPRLVADMPFEKFRSKLVIHFDITFRRGNIKWPRSVKPPRSV